MPPASISRNWGVVADEHELRVGSLDGLHEPREVPGPHHAGLVDHQHRSGREHHALFEPTNESGDRRRVDPRLVPQFACRLGRSPQPTTGTPLTCHAARAASSANVFPLRPAHGRCRPHGTAGERDDDLALLVAQRRTRRDRGAHRARVGGPDRRLSRPHRQVERLSLEPRELASAETPLPRLRLQSTIASRRRNASARASTSPTEAPPRAHEGAV
jgi:hypothetical protein